MGNLNLKSKFRFHQPSLSKTHFSSPHGMAKNKSYNRLEKTFSQWVQTLYRFILHASKSPMWISMFPNHFSSNLSKDSLYGIFLIDKFYCLSLKYAQFAPLFTKKTFWYWYTKIFKFFMKIKLDGVKMTINWVIWGQNYLFSGRYSFYLSLWLFLYSPRPCSVKKT